VALRLGPFRFPWLGKAARDDPYWESFINKPLADLANSIPELIRNAPEGNIFPTKDDIHTPEITSGQVKELARYLGADLVGITRLDTKEFENGEGYPFAVICAVHAEVDPRVSPGVGGQVPVQNGLFVTFVLSAWIRELGFRATAASDSNAERLAAAAGLGTVNSEGRLATQKYGTHVHVANVIRTDLPLIADG